MAEFRSEATDIAFDLDAPDMRDRLLAAVGAMFDTVLALRADTPAPAGVYTLTLATKAASGV